MNQKVLAVASWFKVIVIALALIFPNLVKAQPPTISTWYGYSNGPFGQPGISQKWANILGNVATDTGLSGLTYRLNGGTPQSLTFGRNNPRLVRPGDFNIELDPIFLNVGSNSVEIEATDRNGFVTSNVVTLNYAPANNVWPLPYTANWGSLTNIQQVEKIAHIVDGSWALAANGIRSYQPGYDRAIAIGDKEWQSDYQVTVPVTLHSNFTGIGFGVGWQGHEGPRKPKLEWPLQGLAWVRGPINRPSLDIVTYGGKNVGEVTRATQPVSIKKNVPYMLKTRSESLNNGLSRFYVKFWRQSDTEPSTWNLNADIPSRDGSVLLVTYNADATFGNVRIEPVSGSAPSNSSETTPPVTDNTDVPSGNSGSSQSGLVSDAFDGPLNTGIWVFDDPVGGSTISMTGTQAAISVPAGTNHDLWTNRVFAPRIRQAANDTDFEAEVKFDSAVSSKFQFQGITAEQDSKNLLRFDFYSNGSVTRIFSASFVNGIASPRISSVIADGVPLYLRIKREGNQWTMSYSYNGSNWISGGIFVHDLNLTSVSITAGNAGPTLPAHTALVDHFKVDGISSGTR